MAEQLTEQIFYPGGYADNTMSVKTFDELSALPRGRKFVGLTVVVTNALGDNIPATFWLVKDKSTWVLKDMPAVDSITALNNIPSDYINLGYVAHLTNGDSYIFKGLNEEDSTQQWELTLDREEIDGIISDAVDLAVSNVTSGAPEAFDTLKEIADWIENHGNVAEGIQGEKGDKPTDEEVKAIAVSALTEILIPENASESMDTLAEISSWIQSHPGDASKMNGDIQSLSGQVETLISNNGEENKIETIKVNGSALTVSDKSVDIEIAPAETKTTNDIIVVGGPLADDASDNWPTDADWKDADGNKKIPSGLTFEEVLVKLFSKEVWYTPTISYGWPTSVPKAPSVSISTATTGNLSASQTVEAGTIFYFNGATANVSSETYKVSSNGCTNGYCKDGDKSTYSSGNYSKTYTATTSGDYQLKATVTGFKSNVEGTEAFSIANVDANTAIPSSSDAMYAQEGTNKIVVAQSGLTYSPASSESFETFKLYAASNIKSYSSAYSKDVEYVYSGKTSIVAKGSTDSKVVTGIRHKFYGAKTSVLSLTSDNMRTFSHDATANTFTISVPDKAAQVVIAFPASLGKTLVSVTSAAQLGAAITSNFVKVSGGVDIEGANGYKAINYDVWQYVPSAVWNGTDTLTVTMK